MTFWRCTTIALVILVAGLIWGARPVPPGPEPVKNLSKGEIEEMLTSLSNWGRWGKDDQLGAINLITPEKRRQAAAEVKEGVSVSLSAALGGASGTPAASFQQKMTASGQDPKSDHASDVYTFDYHGAAVTHLDGLSHLFHKAKMYNGFPQQEVTDQGVGRLSIIQLKNGLFTRAVLMDMPRHWGVEYLAADRAIYPADLEAWEKKAGVRVGAGDAILIRTGRWARQAVEGAKAIEERSPGLHASCLPWLKKRDIALIGSDFATDLIPSGVDGFVAPIHWVVLYAMGVPILDNCDFEAVSKAAATRKRWSFLLTAAPLAVEKGTGSPLNPIATF